MLDALVRVVYQLAHRALRLLWLVRRPETNGALVAVWHSERVLLVKNSYRRELTLPGGYVKPREDPRSTAARELHEEVGIRVEPTRLDHAYHGTHDFEHRKDTLDIYELELEREPEVRVDRREVVSAELYRPPEALDMHIVPHLREYLSRRAARGSE